MSGDWVAASAAILVVIASAYWQYRLQRTSLLTAKIENLMEHSTAISDLVADIVHSMTGSKKCEMLFKDRIASRMACPFVAKAQVQAMRMRVCCELYFPELTERVNRIQMIFVKLALFDIDPPNKEGEDLKNLRFELIKPLMNELRDFQTHVISHKKALCLYWGEHL